MGKIAISAYRKIVSKISGHGIGKFYPFRIAKIFFINRFKSDFAEIQGHKMYVDTLFAPVSVTGIWEPVITEYVKKMVKKGDIVLDIGAHIGYYTLIFSDCVGLEGKVFAFEPNPDNFTLLKKNVEINKYENVVLIQKAVSNKAGRLKLYLSALNSGDNRIYDLGDGPRKSIEIEAVRLDDYFKDYDGKIDFIKMDIQGAEGAAMEGMEILLEKNRNLKIITEFWPFGLKGFGIDPETYLQSFLIKGFKLYRINNLEKKIEPSSISEILPDHTLDKNYEVNLLWIRED